MKDEVSAPSGEGLAISKPRTLNGFAAHDLHLAIHAVLPRATTLTPLSKLNVVPGLGQPNSMVWPKAGPVKTAKIRTAEMEKARMVAIIIKSQGCDIDAVRILRTSLAEAGQPGAFVRTDRR